MCRTEQHGGISLRRPKPSKEEAESLMKKKKSAFVNAQNMLISPCSDLRHDVSNIN